jgi:tRNA(Ile)-lysidine synthase TilS/MesJ
MNLKLPPKPPWPKVGKKIESLVRKALYEFDMLKEESSLLVALSGGKDSLTLLSMLAAISNRGFNKIKLYAAHVKTSFSNSNVKYLKEICSSLNTTFIPLTSKISKENLQCYKCSRNRRTLIFNLAKKLKIENIAFGHHRDDNIQTLLLNLFQKGEFAAMLPKIKMHNYKVTIIRPLIFVKESEIENFANYFKFKTLSCNCKPSKNSKRKETEKLINQIEKFFPNVKNNLSLSAFLYGSKKSLRIKEGCKKSLKPIN